MLEMSKLDVDFLFDCGHVVMILNLNEIDLYCCVVERLPERLRLAQILILTLPCLRSFDWHEVKKLD